ncbi:MAG: MBL fold metallo-hydrolase [Bacteroidetes bacterium]|nr:MBL fold metallo-hydrolase [Bacteroidota bacterium]MBS1540863.1 MBL fold metallo-hydrolase [Bacteroidota bacterium]
MKVTFLGTGTSQGVPVIGCMCEVCRSLDYRDKRLRVSVYIEVDGLHLVIDSGPDFRQQMLREQISKLDALLLTHSHKDHLAGLDDVRAFNYLQKKSMPVYGSYDTLAQLKKEFYYAFSAEKYPGTPQIDLFEIDENEFSLQGIRVVPLPVKHMYMPVLGFRIGDFSYVTDANYISDETVERMKGTKVLVLNALQKDMHPSHFTLDQALVQAQRIGAGQTYFTHISHKMGLHGAVSQGLPSNTALAYDGLAVTL